MSKKRLALFDLDTIMFLVAYDQYIKQGNRDRSEAVVLHVKEFINTILVNTRADVYSMAYQVEGHKNFRKYYYPSYKSKRPPSPDFVVHWKPTILETFKELGAIGVKVIESDDVLSIGYYKMHEEYDIILVSADKDLKQLPGEHYNPKTNKSFMVTEEEAREFLWIQTLAGDSTDDISGIYGMGDVKAKAVLDEANELTTLEKVHLAYIKHSGENWYAEYQKTQFLVSLLNSLPNTYTFKDEVTLLFNVLPVSDLVVTNLFN